MDIDKIALLFIRGGKLLATVSKGKDVFYMPGGKREPGESDVHVLTREIKEELSVDIIPESISYYSTFKAQAHGQPEGVMVRMACYTGELEGELKPSSEIERIIWVTSRDADAGSPVDKLILDDLKTNGLID